MLCGLMRHAVNLHGWVRRLKCRRNCIWIAGKREYHLFAHIDDVIKIVHKVLPHVGAAEYGDASLAPGVVTCRMQFKGGPGLIQPRSKACPSSGWPNSRIIQRGPMW